MIRTDFVGRVMAEAGTIVLVLAIPASWLGGITAALGVLAGGILGVGNFWWLAGQAGAACAAAAGGRGGEGWLLSAALRFMALAAACAVLFVTGWIHPVALVVGLTVLPCELVACGLRAARADR